MVYVPVFYNGSFSIFLLNAPHSFSCVSPLFLFSLQFPLASHSFQGYINDPSKAHLLWSLASDRIDRQQDMQMFLFSAGRPFGNILNCTNIFSFLYKMKVMVKRLASFFAEAELPF